MCIEYIIEILIAKRSDISVSKVLNKKERFELVFYESMPQSNGESYYPIGLEGLARCC
jgi:hypothetical protein